MLYTICVVFVVNVCGCALRTLFFSFIIQYTEYSTSVYTTPTTPILLSPTHGYFTCENTTLCCFKSSPIIKVGFYDEVGRDMCNLKVN